MVSHRDMLFTEFPKMGEITKKAKSQNMKRVFTGGVRIGSGMYRTDKAMKKYIKKNTKRNIP